MKIKNEDYIEWRKYFSVVIMCKDTFLGTSYTKNKNQKIGKIMCTHYCCVLIEDIFIHLVMRFPGTETRIKKNQNKTCVHNCVVNPQRNLVKLNTQNGIGLNVFFLVGTICKHQNT